MISRFHPSRRSLSCDRHRGIKPKQSLCRGGFIVFALIVSFFLSSQTAHAANYFNWGVETLRVDYGINGPGAYDVSSIGNTVRDCTVSHSGSCSTRIVVIGNDNQNQGLGWDLVQQNPNYPFNYVGGPSLYYRWWMRIEPGFLWQGTGQKTKSSRAATAGEQPFNYYTGYLNAGFFEIGECDTSGCLTNTGGGTGGGGELAIPYNFRTKADGQWHEYIVRIKPNTSASCTAGVNCDAEFQAYVDGISIGSYNNFKITDLRNPGTVLHDFWGGWMVKPYFQMGDSTGQAGGTIYLDDFSVDDTFNSTYSGGTPAFTFSANPTSITSGQSSTLTWSAVTNATSCTASGGTFTGSKSTSGGTQSVSPTSTTTYTLSCTGAGGTTNQSATVTVGPIAGSECPSNWKTLHPEWIWCDDFETDKTTSYFEKTGPFNRTTGVGLSGSYGMRATWTSGTSDAGSLKLAFGLTPPASGITPPAGVDTTTKFREVYFRAYLKSQAGWVSGANSASKFARATVFSAADWSEAMIAHLWSSGTNNNYLGIDPASCVSGSTVQCVGYNDFAHLQWLGAVTGPTPIFTSPNTGNWNCIEAHVKLNDAGQSNGVEEFWIDDQLEASSTNLNFVGSYAAYGINAILLENYINNGAPQAQVRDWDHLVVSTQRITCTLGGGADTTPPAVTTRTLSANGTTLTLAMSETTSVGAGGNGGFSVTRSSGVSTTVTYALGDGSNSLVYTLSPSIKAGENVTLTYVQPGNGLEDTPGNDLASFSGASVTNNSTQQYSITTSAGANGSIGSSTSANYNATVGVSVTANTGYTATVGGTCGGAPNSGTGTFTYTTNVVTANCTVTASFADQTAPTSPSSLNVTAVSNSQINLSWSASSDGVGVAGYNIERCTGAGCVNFAEIYSTSGTGTAYNNTGLSASTLYRYRVRARDAVLNYSGYSPIGQATTAAPTTHTVTCLAGANGLCAPSSQQVTSGQTASVSISPNAGYKAVLGGTCGGSPAEGIGSFVYTTNAVMADCQIAATFSPVFLIAPPINLRLHW